jgi:hypothetical protein
MPSAPRSTNQLPRRNRLATTLSVLLAVSVSPAIANTWTVNACNEGATGDLVSRTGSLRFAAANAGSNDVIDMTGLPALNCSVITLKTGAVTFPQDELTINGPGIDALTISGKYAPNAVEHDRIFHHTGTGWLRINDLSVAYGYYPQTHQIDGGGCIKSSGNLSLDHVKVSHCKSYGSSAENGGGVSTKGDLWLLNSIVSFNAAKDSDTGGETYGGGAYAAGNFVSINSTIANNAANGNGDGGGVLFKGSGYLYASTISNNLATGYAGGMGIPFGPATIANTTISGNSAHGAGGLSVSGSVAILNSSILFNTASNMPGIAIFDFHPANLTLQSSLIAHNITTASVEDDLNEADGGNPGMVTLSGSRNIVRAPAIDVDPAIAISGVCPLVGPLRNNGGPTATHSLLSGSPGIDQGDAGNFAYDQRDFLRMSGNGADIGAYEIDQSDVIFNAYFEGCPSLP